MDWSGILGFAMALGVISLVSWSAEKFMGYLERPFGASET
jgi:hypothetical protein